MTAEVSIDALGLSQKALRLLAHSNVSTVSELDELLRMRRKKADRIVRLTKTMRDELRNAIRQYSESATSGSAVRAIETSVTTTDSADLHKRTHAEQASRDASSVPIAAPATESGAQEPPAESRGFFQRLDWSWIAQVIGAAFMTIKGCITSVFTSMFGWVRSNKIATIFAIAWIATLWHFGPISIGGIIWPGPETKEEMSLLDKDKKTAIGANIIFVHGLDGNAADTWRNKETGFDFPGSLSEDFPELGVWVVNYDASSRNQNRRPLPIVDRGRVLLEQIKQKSLQENNLILIGHSLGGLVIKQMLREASGSFDGRSEEVAFRTKGVAFLATPHAGGQQGLVGFVNTFSLLYQPSALVQDLQYNNPYLRDLNLWYRGFARNAGLKNSVLIETSLVPGLKNLVVSNESGDPGVPEVPLPVPGANHISIVKPDGREALVYTTVAAFIKKVLQPLGKKWDIEFPAFVDELGQVMRRYAEHPDELRRFVIEHSWMRVTWKVKVRAIRNDDEVRGIPDNKKLRVFTLEKEAGIQNRDQVNIASFSRWQFRPDIKVGDVIVVEGAIGPGTGLGGVQLLECRVLEPTAP
jgi:pimeloyl-ACP methyl ester carboxylesterase